MKLKKVIIVVLSISLVCGAIGGGIYAYKAYQKKNLVAEVIPVSSLNWGYYGEAETSYGMVTNDDAQEIYLEDSNDVEEVYVEEGDEVKEGDKLFKYDTTEIEIDIKRKELDLSTLNNNLAIAKHELEKLKQTTPIADDAQTVGNSNNDNDDDSNTEVQTLQLPEKDTKDSRIYNYVTENSVAYNEDSADGSESDPYIFYCNKGAYAYGSFFNKIRPDSDGTGGKYVKFIICKKDSNGKMLFEEEATEEDTTNSGSTGRSESTETVEGLGDSKSTTIDTKDITVTDDNKGANKVPVVDDSISNNTIVYNGNALMTEYDDDCMWSIFTGEEVTSEVEALLDELNGDDDEEDDDNTGSDGYTKSELIEAISEKEEEIQKLDLERRQQELQLETLKQTAEDGIVYATMDGKVKSIGDPDEGDMDGAYMVVSADDGLYVKGQISELLLDQVKPGTKITANSWETGNTFEATVTEIYDYPVESNSWGEGNPNVSYYEYTAYIEDSSALKNGEYVDLSIAADQSSSGEGGIYIEKAYVRQENGKSYCMIADENGLLKKQYVVTGKTIYGSAVEIKSGLSETDLIAFPYGKNAVEGATVTEETEYYY